MTGENNVCIGIGCGIDMSWQNRCTLIGQNIPSPDADDVIRIGTGDVYLEVRDGKVTIVGAEPDEAAKAVLEGLNHASDTMLKYFMRSPLPEDHLKADMTGNKL